MYGFLYVHFLISNKGPPTVRTVNRQPPTSNFPLLVPTFGAKIQISVKNSSEIEEAIIIKLAGMAISQDIHQDTYHAIVIKYDHTLDPRFLGWTQNKD